MEANSDAKTGPLSAELKGEIREFARQLPKLDFYEVLDTPVHSNADAIRDAFFARSRAYHPDRFFGKDIGPYSGLVNEIFKRVAAAYEVLRDPELRRAYDRSLKRDPARPKRARPTLRAPRARKRSDSVLLGLQRQLDLTRSKARRHFDEAMECASEGELKRAHGLLRLALIFDPRERAYQDAMGELALKLNRTGAPGASRTDPEEKS